jgi:hypothetical protein
MVCASSLSHSSDESLTSDVRILSLHSFIPVKENRKLQQALQLIRAKKIKLDSQDAQGNTCLHLLIPYMHEPRAVRFACALIRNGASVHIENKWKRTPFDIAMECKRRLLAEKKIHVADVLHGSSRDIDAMDYQVTALTILFEGMPPVKTNEKLLCAKDLRYFKKPTRDDLSRIRDRFQSAKPCS